MYKTMERNDSDKTLDWVSAKISAWNHSQKLLAEVLSIALKKAMKNASPSTPIYKMFETINSTWSNRSNNMVTNGVIMFWALKEILHSDPGQSAFRIKAMIDQQDMVLSSSTGSPLYAPWIANINKLAEALEEYDEDGYSPTMLVELFIQKYKSVLPHSNFINDKIIDLHNSNKLSWKFLMSKMEECDLRSIVDLRTANILAGVNVSMKSTQVMYAAAPLKPLNDIKSPRGDANKPSEKNKPIQELSKVVAWNLTGQCALHPCAHGKTHTNAECKSQLSLRARN
jgi:hypothetical protein